MSVDAAAVAGRTAATPRQRSAADRFMRRLLRVSATDQKVVGDAHRAFRTSVFISGIRCLITYLLIPVLVPLLSFAGVVAAPVGIALCTVAVVNGIISVRRFWVSDHRSRWMYTWFMAVVFVVLGIALYSDISRLVSMA